MISIEEQESLFLNISRRLKKKITMYAIGGTAMMFLGIKDTTLDIDLVFDNDEDKNIFKEAAQELGYRAIDIIKLYGTKRNPPELLKLNDERFDLFVKDVIDFVFSESMKERAEQTLQFRDNLILKIANPHDIILMKCATDRLKDKDDARKIIETKKIDWELILDEAKNQIGLGKERALFDLGCFLEDLKNEMHLPIPTKVLNDIFKLVKKQIDTKNRVT